MAAAPSSAAGPAAGLGAIQYDSPGKDTRSNASLNAEWVTVMNKTGKTLDLNGWTLADADRLHLPGAYKSVKVPAVAGTPQATCTGARGPTCGTTTTTATPRY